MEALLKHGDRVIPESGVSNLDIELKRLKNESVDLFHQGVLCLPPYSKKRIHMC